MFIGLDGKMEGKSKKIPLTILLTKGYRNSSFGNYLSQFQTCPSGPPKSFNVVSNASTSDFVPQKSSVTPVFASVQVVQISLSQLEINMVNKNRVKNFRIIFMILLLN